MKSSNKNPIKLIKSEQSSFINIDEASINNLSIYAMAVYLQLRLLKEDPKDNEEEIKITIKCLAQKSKMSQRKVYDALNELEYCHHIVQRVNYYHNRFGKVNAFKVSRTYNFFKINDFSNEIREKKDKNLYLIDKYELNVQNESDTAPSAVSTACDASTTARNDVTTAQESETLNNDAPSEVQDKFMTAPCEVGTAQNDIPYKNNYLFYYKNKNNVINKQNKEKVIFNNKSDIEKHIFERAVATGQFVDEDSISQIVFYIGDSLDTQVVNKKTNIALKLIRENKWNIPHGWNGITSQSIKAKEEAYQKAKEESYKSDKKAIQLINEGIRNCLSGFKDTSNEKKQDKIIPKEKQGRRPEFKRHLGWMQMCANLGANLAHA
jgi:hypothetical protein